MLKSPFVVIADISRKMSLPAKVQFKWNKEILGAFQIFSFCEDTNQGGRNKEKEHDWFIIKFKDKVLDINCGPDNLTQIFTIFLDEIIPNHSDSDILYDIYIPLSGHLQRENSLQKIL